MLADFYIPRITNDMKNNLEVKFCTDLWTLLINILQYNINFRIVPQCEHSLSGMKNIIQRQNFENIVRQMRTLESRLVLLNDKLVKIQRKDKFVNQNSNDRYTDSTNITKTDLLVEVAQLRAKNNKCTCQRKDPKNSSLARIINGEQAGQQVGCFVLPLFIIFRTIRVFQVPKNRDPQRTRIQKK